MEILKPVSYTHLDVYKRQSLQGTKEKGIDDYTGSYTANYEDFSGTEYLFGGTSIKREAGKDLSIDLSLIHILIFVIPEKRAYKN